MEAFLHGPDDTARCNVVFKIMGFLASAAVVAYIDQGANATGDGIGKEDDLAVEVPCGTA